MSRQSIKIEVELAGTTTWEALEDVVKKCHFEAATRVPKAYKEDLKLAMTNMVNEIIDQI